MDMQDNMNVHVNIHEHPTITCFCGSKVYTHGVILKRVPGLVLGTGTEDQIIDLPVFYCAKCKEILPEYKKMYRLDE